LTEFQRRRGPWLFRGGGAPYFFFLI